MYGKHLEVRRSTRDGQDDDASGRGSGGGLKALAPILRAGRPRARRHFLGEELRAITRQTQQSLMRQREGREAEVHLDAVRHLIQTTFLPVRTAKCDQTIRLATQEDEALSGATLTRDGAAGSALLNEARMRYGWDIVGQREMLKQLFVLALRQLKMPLRQIGRGPSAPLCASLRATGAEPQGLTSALARQIRDKWRIPDEILKTIMAFAGPLWWVRRKWDGSLPLPTARLKAFSVDVPPKLHRLFRRVLCFERNEFFFALSRDVMYAEWGPGAQVWMRGTDLYPFVVLLRSEGRKSNPRSSASVVSVRGAGEVLL